MSECFVPNCKNTEGVRFPQEDDLRKKWLDNLKIADRSPEEGSFVCLRHFAEGDLIEGETDFPKEVKKEAIPFVLSENMEVENESTEEVRNQQVKPEENDVKEFQVCRLCLCSENSGKHINNDHIDEISILTVINNCLYPLKISDDDDTSKYICMNCFTHLESYQKFRTMCYSKQNVQESELMAELRIEKRKAENEINCDVKRNRNTYIEDNVNNKKINEKLDGDRKETITDSELERQLEEMENGVQEPDDYLDSDVTFESDNDDNPEDYEIIRTRPIQIDTNNKPETDIDKKFDRVEDELRRVLEGQLSEEQIAAENIIIAVEADEETNTTKTSITEMKLPIVIKPVSKIKHGNNKTLIVGDKEVKAYKQKQKIMVKDGQVTLPKGISVKVPERFVSEVGVFEAVPRVFVFNSEFCMVDDYLFEYRLCKGFLRYLRCIQQNCKSLAVQKKLTNTMYSSNVTIKEPHNHPKPSEKDMKKLMFYHVMKRMMQNDKSMNFKSVYEQICEIDPEIKTLVPLRNVINEICRHQLSHKPPAISSFRQFYESIEDDVFKKLHFTHTGKQFYQEKFEAEENSRAIVFANCDIIDEISQSKLMYIDASFRIETTDEFNYQLVTILVWVEDSYYPILFALVNKKTQEIYKKILEYLHDVLAPELRPDEIVTDYEANLYYALGETYLDSHIGGSVFYYTQNLYKKICSLNLSRDLETNSYFRNIYHMLLMLPLLPVNTISDGLNNIEIQARDLGLQDLTRAIFEHVKTQWMLKVTPDLFCVHRLENRINENVIAPFKKLRDFLMLAKGKVAKHSSTIVGVVEKLIELESFLQITYSTPNKKSFARDLSSSQKKNVLKAWQFIESHPKININNFFTKVLGYIKCMENQLWIWGFYRYTGKVQDDLINAANFLIVSNDVEVSQHKMMEQEGEFVDSENSVVMEAVIDENGGFVLQSEHETDPAQFDNTFLKYVYKD